MKSLIVERYDFCSLATVSVLWTNGPINSLTVSRIIVTLMKSKDCDFA